MSFLQMSLAASVMILVILLIRTLAIHRLPKRFFLLLWVVVLLRLLVFRRSRRYRAGAGAGRRGHYSGRRRR